MASCMYRYVLLGGTVWPLVYVLLGGTVWPLVCINMCYWEVLYGLLYV